MFKVVLTGLVPEVPKDHAIRRLAELFGTNANQITHLLETLPHTLKTGSSRETAENYMRVIGDAGGLCNIQAEILWVDLNLQSSGDFREGACSNRNEIPEASKTLDISNYYKAAFARIEGNQGKPTPMFNWAAFFFGGFWYLYKGMWAKAGLMLLLIFVAVGTPGLLLWVYAGFLGNYDYYLLHIKGKQLW